MGSIVKIRRQIKWNTLVKEGNGSFTVELALIFPVIIAGIVATLYILILLYQFAYLQTLANKVAYFAAAEYDKLSLQILEERGTSAKGVSSLYWQLGIFDDTKGKEAIIESYVMEKLYRPQLLKPQTQKVESSVYNYILYKKLRVRIINDYQLPVLYVNNLLRIKNSFSIVAEGEAVIKDNAEFLRNTDYIIELMDSFEVTSKIKDSYKKTLESWRKSVSEVLE